MIVNTLIIKFMNINRIIILGLRRVYQLFFPPKREKNIVNNPDVVSEMISQGILSNKPFMVSRFGAVEIGAVSNYLSVIKKRHSALNVIKGIESEWWWNEGIRYCMKNNAGFYPNDDVHLAKFGELMLQDMQQIDILMSWQPQELMFSSELKDSAKVEFIWIDPFWSSKPWTKALEGKKVLVIHPFEKEIKDQYFNHRTQLHANPDVLPLFDLKTLKAVQSIGGSSDYETWFDALKHMENEIDKIDFDICLLGCGAYGMPLAAYIKRKGKKAIHFGGSLQLLFGIKGKRWENTDYGHSYFADGIGKYPSLINEHWIRPYSSSHFEAANNVEGGCYW